MILCGREFGGDGWLVGWLVGTVFILYYTLGVQGGTLPPGFLFLFFNCSFIL